MDSKYLVALNCHPKIGSQTLKKALAPFSDDPEKLWKAGESEIRKNMEERVANLIIEAREKYDPEEEIEKLHKLNIGYLTVFDKSYPPLLREIPDYPVILYIKGDLEVLDMPGIGVVGSRKYTAYGQNMAYKLSKECAEEGLNIISGLALGIDSFAHKAALDGGGRTIGVLGCGLDTIYPQANSELAKKILENGGAIISEFPPETVPMKQNFPLRNRIIAGLSLGVLVVEAAEKSGALITAFEAIDYNREVFAVPGDVTRENSVGTNRLIQKGAKLVIDSEDIFSELNFKAKKSKKAIQKIVPESEEEKIILEYLKKGVLDIDKIIQQSKLDVMAVNTTLTILEMKGMVKNIGGGRYQTS